MKKNILITGSTDGIGKLAAIKLAKENHNIFIHGRNKVKLEKVIAEIKTETKNENIKGFLGDLSDFSSINSMIKEVNNSMSSIDVLINNAGVFKSEIILTQRGLDLRYMVNYFAPYLMTKALMPLIKKGQKPRIINLSSAAQSPINFDTFHGKSTQSLNDTYAQSKLALTMWSFDLANTEKDIITIAVNPGSLLDTNMVKEAFGHHWSSADKGRDILYDLAISEEHQDKSGQYFDNDSGHYGRAQSDAYDATKIQSLIVATDKILSDI